MAKTVIVTGHLSLSRKRTGGSVQTRVSVGNQGHLMRAEMYLGAVAFLGPLNGIGVLNANDVDGEGRPAQD